MVIVGASITISSHAKVMARVTITLHWLFILVSHIVLCSLCDTMFASSYSRLNCRPPSQVVEVLAAWMISCLLGMHRGASLIIY
jgi:hypothetical protein